MASAKAIANVDRKLDEAMRTLKPGETLSLSEIAARAGIRKATVQNLYKRGIEKMRSSQLRAYVED